MEVIMIDREVFDRLKQAIWDLVEQIKELTPKQVDKEWCNNGEVCGLLDISLRTLQSYRDKGILPYSQIGHKCYYKMKDIKRFLEEAKCKPNK